MLESVQAHVPDYGCTCMHRGGTYVLVQKSAQAKHAQKARRSVGTTSMRNTHKYQVELVQHENGAAHSAHHEHVFWVWRNARLSFWHTGKPRVTCASTTGMLLLYESPERIGLVWCTQLLFACRHGHGQKRLTTALESEDPWSKGSGRGATHGGRLPLSDSSPGQHRVHMQRRTHRR